MVDKVMAELEALGTAQNRKVYGRHGVKGPMFGVSFANLGKLAKRLKTDQHLAEALWATGNHDARVLATQIADPEALGARSLDAWARDLDNYVVADAFSKLVARGPHAGRKLAVWTRRKGEFVAQVGWNLLTTLVGRGALDDDELKGWVGRIEAEIHDAPNRARHAMNMALIAIGLGNEGLRGLAYEAAERIGPVEVDHGETGCQTPGVRPYIEKALAQLAKRAAKKAARA